MPAALAPDDFRTLEAPLTVEVRLGDRSVELALAVESVAELPPHRLRAAPFSLILRGPRAPLLAQATYALVHPRLGPVEVFLVPIGQDAQATRYEATFN